MTQDIESFLPDKKFHIYGIGLGQYVYLFVCMVLGLKILFYGVFPRFD